MPNIWTTERLYDEFINGTLNISGISSEEDYTYDYNSETHVLAITFFKDKNHSNSGLNSTEQSRDIKITFSTTTNKKWVEAGYSNPNAWSTHENNAKVKANQYEFEVKSSFQLLNTSIHKEAGTDGGSGNKWFNDEERQLYFYMITLEGVTGDTVTVDDIVDKNLLTILPEVDLSKRTDYPLTYRHLMISGNRYADQNSDRNPVTVTETENGYRFTATVPKTTGGTNYSTYYLWYAMAPASGAVAEVIRNGGKITIPNSAEYNGGSSDTVSVEYDYSPIKKTLFDDWKIGNGTRELTYQVVFNEEKIKIGDEETLTISDTFENMAIDYSSIQYTTDPAEAAGTITYDVSGNVMTFIVPNSTKVTITYNTRVVGSGSVNVKNTASFETFKDVIDKTGTYSAGGSGEAETYRINLAKYAKINGKGHMEMKVAGAVFELLESDKSAIKVNNTPVTFTTGSDGTVEIFNSNVVFYPDHQYYLHEIYSPPGFEIDDTYYGFKFGTDADYSQYIYFNGDTLKVYNEKF